MKTSKRNKLLGLALTGSFSLLGATNALAAAGDDILNRATLSYDVGTVTQTAIESSQAGNSNPGIGNGDDTLFKEDRLINFTVTRGGATSQVTPSATLQAVEFTIENLGNGSQGFLLKGLNNVNGTLDPFSANTDIFETTVVQTFVEDGTTPGFQTAEDTAAFITSLAVTPATQVVYVVSTIPSTQSDGTTALATDDVAVMTLVAQVASDSSTGVAGDAIMADDNGNVSTGGDGFTNGTADLTPLVVGGATNPDVSTTVEVVFNDPAGTLDGAGVADIVKNAQSSDNSSYTVSTAELTVAKASSTLWDPINDAVSPKSIPGAYVTYSISIANAAGAADGDLTTLSDVLPLSLIMDPDFVTNDGVTPTSAAGDGIEVTKGGTTIYCTGAADGDGCDYTGGAGGTITVDFANATFVTIMPLAATETVTVNFNVIVQ